MNMFWQKVVMNKDAINDSIIHDWECLMKDGRNLFERSMLTTSYHNLLGLDSRRIGSQGLCRLGVIYLKQPY